MREITTRLSTYKDLIDHGIFYLGANVMGDAASDSRRAAQAGYRNLASMHNWSYYYTRGRLNTVASQSTGTISYDQTGGIYERMATLTGAIWPDWVIYGTLLIGEVVYQVADIKSNTVITLAASSNPGADLPAGTTYTLYRDTYPMPIDFQKADDLIVANQSIIMQYVHPAQWLNHQRSRSGPGRLCFYSFMSDPDFHGIMAVRFSPPPDQIYNIDYIYKRTPRSLLLDEYKNGTATCTFSSRTVTGVDTAWTMNHIGSVIRFSNDTTTLPTGLSGTNPFQLQRIIVAVASAVSLTVDQDVPETLTGVKHTISDPVDIETGSMLTALHREIEKEMRIARRMKPAPEEEVRYQQAIMLAMEADNRSFARQYVGGGVSGTRLSDFPTGVPEG